MPISEELKKKANQYRDSIANVKAEEAKAKAEEQRKKAEQEKRERAKQDREAYNRRLQESRRVIERINNNRYNPRQIRNSRNAKTFAENAAENNRKQETVIDTKPVLVNDEQQEELIAQNNNLPVLSEDEIQIAKEQAQTVQEVKPIEPTPVEESPAQPVVPVSTPINAQDYQLGEYQVDNTVPNSSIGYVMPPIERKSLEKNTWADDLIDLYNIALNGITRKYNQYIANNDDETIEQTSIVNVPEKEQILDNDSINNDSIDYNDLGLIDTISVPIIPASYFGDTIKFKKASRRDFTVPNQYILPGSINLADYKFGFRNRGDKTPLTTQGGIVTAFNNFLPFNSNKKYIHGSYYGIDAEGNFKHGDYTDFGLGDYLTRTQSNDVIEILRNEDGTVKLKQSAKNTFAGSPITRVVQGNDTINGSINFLSSSIKENKGKNTVPVFRKGKQIGYASPYLFDGSRGGSIIATAGDEARLFTGSIANIADFFDEMKARYPDQPIRLYNVDNGTYSKGLRTINGKINSEQLRMYDNQNLGGGGNFLYIKRNGGNIRHSLAKGGRLKAKDGEESEEYYPIWLDGITVKPSGNRPTTRDDWNWANWREKQNEREKKATESVRKGIDRNGTPIAAGIYGLAAAPFAIEGLGSSALPNGVRTGLQAMNTFFTPSTWLNPVTGAKLLSPTVGTIADAGIQGAFVYQGLNDLYNQRKEGTLLSDPASTFMHGLEVLPLVGASANVARNIVDPAVRNFNLWKYNVGKRGVESVLRTTNSHNPLPETVGGIIEMGVGKQGGPKRLFNVARYILSGKKNGVKGYYNSFAPYDSHSGRSRYFTGFYSDSNELNGKDDLIDAFLYGKDIDPAFGVKKVSVGEGFGVHSKYIKDNYFDKSSNIPVYELNTIDGIPEEGVVKTGNWYGADSDVYFGTNNGTTLNAAGHMETEGLTPNGTRVIQAQDIWKFNPSNYNAKWLGNPNTVYGKLLRLGLKKVDSYGTPVILRTKWQPAFALGGSLVEYTN